MEAPDIKNLSDLIGFLRSKLNNVSARETLERLQNILGDEVTIRYEIVASKVNTVNTVSTVSTGNTVNTVSTVSTGNTVSKDSKHSKYSHTEGKIISRILLSTFRRGKKLSTELYRQLNGLVFQLPGWKLLSVAAPILNFNFKMNEMVQNLSSYDIYPVIDGTVVTLYWYESQHTPNGGSWRLSSTNGYDVTDMRWLGARTYMEALLELTNQYPTFSLDRLNRSCSYTIGFRHPEFQPMKYDGARIWFIQSCNTSMVNNLSVANIDISKMIGQSAGNMKSLLSGATIRPVLMINTREDIGLPIQAPIQFPEDMTDEKIFSTLRLHNENALTEFSKSLSGDFVTSPHYGYFLRPKVNDPELCDIMFESTLLHLIKNALYNFPKKRGVGESDLTPENRMEYAKLRAYLSNTIKYPFITLFPQFQIDYTRYDALFNKIAERIMQIIRKPTDRKSNDPRIELIAQKFAGHIKEKQINVLNSEGMLIILDFLRDRRYLELYFSVLVVGGQ
jgi:hypothetical protein